MMPFEWLQRATFEAPATVAMGPHWSALVSGFAVLIGGRVFLTDAGERYLASVNCGEGRKVAL
jgi:hypothetical protein